jgi:hypothetical protein
MRGNLEELVEQVRRKVADTAEAALRQAVAGMRSGEQHFGQVERQVQEQTRPLGAVVLEAALQTMGNGKERCHRACACRGTMRYVCDRPKTLQTLFGPVEVRRAYYHCATCGRGDIPLDRALGVEGTSLTAAVQEVAAWADAEMAYGRAAQFLERVLGLDLSKDTHETLSGDLGRAVQPKELERADAAWKALRPAEDFYITCDGLKVNTLQGWKEPKLGAIFRAGCNEKGEPIRGPTRYVAHLEEAEPFGQRLWQLAEALGVRRAKRVTVLGDGAPWIWNLARFYFPEAVQIVDFYHGAERLAELARSFWSETSSQARCWLESAKSLLHQGKIAPLLRTLRRLTSRRKDLRDLRRKAIGYFTENRERMRYDRFRKMGLFIGSGVVEAGCKTVVAFRFKQSGMRWSQDGFLNLLHLRLCILNGDWDVFARSYYPRLRNLAAAYF